MSITERIFKIISNYLSLKETDEERKELYKWYDQLKIDKRINSSDLRHSYSKSKIKLFEQINQKEKNIGYKRIFWQCAVAASVIMVASYVVFNYYNHSDKYQQLQIAEINNIMPRPQKAILSFSNGTQINPDTLTLNKKILISNDLVISKNGSGAVVFTATRGADKANVTGALQTYQATKYSLILTDGTKVYLNANSQLTFPVRFATHDRVVNLKGEGYFEVTKTLKHTKFFVKTDEQVVRVLGTKFNIRSYNHKAVQTTLLEGSVSITPTDKFFQPVIIKPNQQAILKSNGVQISKIEASKALAWKEGFFVFDGGNTLDMLTDIAKWYGLELDTTNADHLKEHTGKIPSNVSLGQLIELLDYSGVHVKVYKDGFGKHKLFIL